MSKPEIIVERTVDCGEYCYKVGEHADFPGGARLSYWDFEDGKFVSKSEIAFVSIEELDAVISALNARRSEIADYNAKNGIK